MAAVVGETLLPLTDQHALACRTLQAATVSMLMTTASSRPALPQHDLHLIKRCSRYERLMDAGVSPSLHKEDAGVEIVPEDLA